MDLDESEDVQKILGFMQNLGSDESTEYHDSSGCLQNTSESHKECFYSDDEYQEKVKKFQKCLESNKKCKLLLDSVEAYLVRLLHECVKEKKRVNLSIDMFEARKASGHCHKNSRSLCIRKACSSPYFKDYKGFPSKYNEDVSRRENAGFPNPWDVIKTVPWTDDQKRTLEITIKNYENPVSQSLLISNDTNHDKPSTSTTFIDSIEEKYDWITISVVHLNNTHSPLECRAMWFNYLHPKINKNRWSERESDDLEKLVDHYVHQNWDVIAHDLKTNRSAYQCICHLKIRLSDFSKISWREEEWLLLQNLVRKLRVNDFIPWYKIAWLMDGRNSTDIYRKWVSRYGGLKKGQFSLKEDIILAAGLKEFGQDWKRIAEYLPNRLSTQVRSHILVLKSREQYSIPWTESEDELLENLVQKYGFGNWAKISSHFITRNNVQVRTRYKTLSNVKKRLLTGATIKSKGCRGPKRYNEDRSLKALWEAAQKLVEDKSVDNATKELTTHANITHAVSQICKEKPRKKRGRKKGSVNHPIFQKPYYDFFHVAYCQRGGRGKDKYTKEKIPTMAYQIVLCLPLLNANIVLPNVKELVYQDNAMLEMDKSVISYLIDKKEIIQDNCKFIHFEGDSCSSNELPSSLASMEKSNVEAQSYSDWYPLCPPSASTLIGLRTMLLNRTNINAQSKGETVQESEVPTQHSTKTSEYFSACKLWNKRLEILFTWANLLSTLEPKDQIIFDPPTVEKNVSSKVPCKVKKKGKKRINNSIDKSESVSDQNKDNDSTLADIKPKRAYVKSGKYKIRNKVCGNVRRSTRSTKTDL